MNKPIKAIVCDFDGTFSTLRCGWEKVMKRMMMKYLPDEAWIDDFIGETTGVQTILQMKGFVAELKRRGGSRSCATDADAQERVPPDDPWFYKNEYNGMLMESVSVKRDEGVIRGQSPLAELDVCCLVARYGSVSSSGGGWLISFATGGRGTGDGRIVDTQRASRNWTPVVFAHGARGLSGPSCSHRRPFRQAALRCGGAGCTWRYGRYGSWNRS